MALNKAEKAALEAIAAELEVMETWNTGPRSRRVRALTEKVRGLADGSVDPQDVVDDVPNGLVTGSDNPT